MPSPSPVALRGRLTADASPGPAGIRLDLELQKRPRDRADPGASVSPGVRSARWASGPYPSDHDVPAPRGVRLTVAGSLGAERAGEWRAGRIVLVPASLREPPRSLDPGVADGRLDLARRGMALVGSVKSGALVEVVGRGTWWQERAAGFRRFARAALARHVGRWDSQSAAIVVAILVGDRVGLSDEVQERLRQAGTYHVIAISGGNIAILAALLFALLRLALVPVRVACPLVMAALAGYASLVGGGASVLRATAMACGFLAARQLDFRSPPINGLAVAAAAILVATPLALVDPAFALTFGATLGILVGGRLLRAPGDPRPRGSSSSPPSGSSELPGNDLSPTRYRRPSWNPVRRARGSSSSWNRALAGLRPLLSAASALLFASISAELALFPVSAYAFSRVTFAGLLLNFLAIPLMTLAQVSGMAVLALAGAGMEGALAAVAGWLAHVGAKGLVVTSAFVDLVPWLAWRLPPPHPVALAAYYGGWCGWLWLRDGNGLRLQPAAVAGSPLPGVRGPYREPRRRGWWSLPERCALLLRAGCGVNLALRLVIAVSSLWILTEPVTLLFPGVSGRLRVAVLDVGHADAILLQLPDRRSVLVDAGGSIMGGSFDVGGRVIAPALWALGTRRLDALVITHGDPDHVGGAASIVRDFRPREVWEGVPVPGNAGLERVRELALGEGAAWRQRRAGERIALGGALLLVHHPPPPDWERRKVRNDDSVVLEVRYGDVSVVLPGDIGRGVERAIIPSLSPQPLCVLKVPHHGSASSSSPEFLAALHPAVAVISASSTTRVSADVLARYQSSGAALFRTNEDGALTMTTDGHALTIETFTGRRLQIRKNSTTKNTMDTKKTTKK